MSADSTFDRRLNVPRMTEHLESRVLMSASAGDAAAALNPAAPGSDLAAAALSAARRVTGFQLIDVNTDRPVAGSAGNLVNGSVVNLATLAGGKLDVRALTNPATVGSVLFRLNGGGNRFENASPYSLFGDVNGDYRGRALSPGRYTLTAVPYGGPGGLGGAGTFRTVTFTVVNRPVTPAPTRAVTGFKLINVNTDQPVAGAAGDLIDGAVINRATLPGGRFDVRALTNPPTVGSVRFTLTGRPAKVENAAPYSVFGDVNGDYRGQALPAGQYTLTATPYAGRNAGGAAGAARSVTFTVVNQAQPQPGGPSIAGLQLVDARPLVDDDPAAAPRNAHLADITDGATIDLADLRTRRLNVLAQVAAQSVRFEVDGGAVVRTRNAGAGPLALFGQNDPNVAPTLFAPGDHTVRVTAFAGPDGTGAAGPARTFRVTVADGDESPDGLQTFVDFDRDGSLADEAPLGDQVDRLRPVVELAGDDNDETVFVEDKYRVLVRNAGGGVLTLNGGIDLSLPAGGGRVPSLSANAFLFPNTVILGTTLSDPFEEPGSPSTVSYALYDPLDPAYEPFGDDAGLTREKRLAPGEALSLTLFGVPGTDLRDRPATARGTVQLTTASGPRAFDLTILPDPDGGPPVPATVVAAPAAPSGSGGVAGTATAPSPLAVVPAGEGLRLTAENARTRQEVAELLDAGTVLNRSTLPDGRVNFVATFDPTLGTTGSPDIRSVTRVRFVLDGVETVDESTDANGFGFARPTGSDDFRGLALAPGDHVLEVTLFESDVANGGEKVAVTRTARFTVAAPTAAPAVTGLTLVDASPGPQFTNAAPRLGGPVLTLTDGASFDLADLARFSTRLLNVRAEVSGAVGSVKLVLDGGAAVRVRNAAPYALYGDNDAPGAGGGGGVGGLFVPGEHVIEVTPYAGPDATGVPGPTRTFRVTVRDSFNDDGVALYIDFDDDGSLADEAAVGEQEDEIFAAGDGDPALVTLLNTGGGPLILDGAFRVSNDSFVLRLPTELNPGGPSAASADDLAAVSERADEFDLLYEFRQPTGGGPLVLAPGESLSLAFVNDQSDSEAMRGTGSPLRRSNRMRRFRGRS